MNHYKQSINRLSIFTFVMAKTALNKEKTIFTNQQNLYLRNKLVKCYIRSTVLYGADTCTLRKVDQKYLQRL